MSTSPNAAHLRRSAVGLSLLAVLVASGCSGGGQARPELLGPEVASSAPPVAGLTASPAAVWGEGRALTAEALAGGSSFAVVTTTGVYVSTPGTAPTALDTFDSAAEIGPSAASPDSTTLAVAIIYPPSVRIYDLTTGTRTATYDLPADATVRSLVFTGGRSLMADTTVGPFVSADPSSAPLAAIVDTPTSGVSAVLAGGTVATPMTNTSDIVVTGPGGSERRTLPVPDGAAVVDARSAPGGGVLAVSARGDGDEGSGSDLILILDAATLEPRATIDVGTALASNLWAVTDEAVMVADGSSISSWTFDGVPTNTPASNSVASMEAVLGGLVTVAPDGAVTLFSAAGGSPAVIRPGGITLRDLQLSPDRSVATGVDYFGVVTAWSTADGTQLASEEQFASGEATGVAISVDGTEVGVATSSGRVAVLDDNLVDSWDLEASQSAETVGAVSFDPATGAVATGLAQRESATSFDDAVTVWDSQQRAPRFTVGGEKEAVLGCSAFYSRIRYSDDATMMAVTSHNYSALMIDIASGAVLHEFPGTTTILDLAFSPDDDLLVATYDDGTVNVWQTSDYSLAATYRGAPGGYFAIAIMPDSATMVAADVTGSIGLIDLMTGTPLRSFADASQRTSTLALTADGALLAAPTASGGIGIWSTFSGTRVSTLYGHTGDVTGLAFAPSGEWLASSSSDGTARTWTLSRIN